MAGPKPQDVYQGYNASPSGIADTDSPAGRGPRFSVQANPSDFGANVGQALEQAGKTGEQLGADASQIAVQMAGQANETAATNADAALASKVGSIYGKYATLTGSAAVAAAAQTKADIIAAQQDALKDMPPAAARATQLLTARSVANRIVDVDTYAAQQAKEANRSAGLNLVNVQMDVDGPTATDAVRFGERVGNVKHGVGMQMQDSLEPHLQTDPDTGATSINDSTPEGSIAKATYQQNVDSAVGQLWFNRISTISNLPGHGPIAAQQMFLDNKDDIPPIAAAHIDASLGPQVYNAHVNQAFMNGLNDVKTDYFNHLTNPSPSSAGSNAYNLGNVKTASGAVNNTQDFVSPASPADGALLAANTLRSGYQGLTLQQIGDKWSNKDPNWAQNVSKISGIDINAVPNLNDPATLKSLLTGMASQEKSAKDRVLFTDDIINQGVQASLAGKQVNQESQQQSSQQPTSQKPYATNEDGSLMSQADYMQLHRSDILSKWANWADKQMPGDLQFRNQVVERANQQIDRSVQGQAAAYRQDNSFVIKAINGDMTNGKPPASYNELAAIPQVKQVLDRVEAQDPRFSQGIEGMIARVNKPKGDAEEISYGPNYHQLRDDIWSGKITDLKDLQHAASTGDITQKGYDYLSKQLPAEAKDPIKQANENRANANTFSIVRSQITHGMTEQSINANPEIKKTIASADTALQLAIDERKSRNVPAAQYYDPNNKEWIGNDAKVFQVTHAAAVAATIKANQASAHPVTLGDIIAKAKATNDPKIQAQLRQQAIDLGFYDPNAKPPPEVPVAGAQ